MARGTGNKRGPRQPTQRQANPAAIRQAQQQQQQQQQPHLIQGQPQQQYQQQPIMQPGSQPMQQQPQQWYTAVRPQQIRMPPRLQQQQQQQQQQLQFIPQQQQQPPPQQPHQQQQQQLQLIPQQINQQMPPVQSMQKQPTQITPQVVTVGSKRRAQEPAYVLSEHALRDPLINALERNINKHLISHTLHRTFGAVKIF